MCESSSPRGILPEEILVRSVHPEKWSYVQKRVESGTFRDRNGVSVDRRDGRSDDEILKAFRSRGFIVKAMIEIPMELCIELGLHVVPLPVSGNDHHAEIHSSPEKRILTKGQSRSLATRGKVIWVDENMNN